MLKKKIVAGYCFRSNIGVMGHILLKLSVHPVYLIDLEVYKYTLGDIQTISIEAQVSSFHE